MESEFKINTMKSWGSLLKASIASWNEDKALRLSAAIAYYAVFSIAPLLVISMGIAGLVLGSEAATGQIYDGLRGYIGSQAAESVQAMVKSASKPTHGVTATVVGFIVLLIGASGVLGQLKDALNTVWAVKPKPGLGVAGFIRDKFLNFGMVLAIGFLMLASLVLSSILTAANKNLESVFSLPPAVWLLVSLLFSLTLTSLLMAMIFKILPDAEVQYQDVWLGAVLTAILLEVGKTALSWYLGLESTSSAYGTAGSVVLLLLWVYYTSCIVLFGAEFTRAHARLHGRPIAPSAHAVAASAAEREEEGMEPKLTSLPPLVPPTSTPGTSLSYKHRLMGPLLRYIEARGLLVSLEAKEAAKQSVALLILAALSLVSILLIWLLMTTALVGFLTEFFGGGWIRAVLTTAALHALVLGIAGGFLYSKFRSTVWFADTINELRKDRQWLKKQTPQS